VKLICYEIILSPKGVYQVSKKNIKSIYIYIYEIVMCKTSTEVLILNQSMCFSHRPLFCVASSVFACPYIKIQMPSFVMPVQTVENAGVIKKKIFIYFWKAYTDVDSTFWCWHHMEMPRVSTVFLRVLSEYGENAFVLHRQVVTQTHRRGSRSCGPV